MKAETLSDTELQSTSYPTRRSDSVEHYVANNQPCFDVLRGMSSARLARLFVQSRSPRETPIVLTSFSSRVSAPPSQKVSVRYQAMEDE